ncbi:MAG: hypothetical protein GPW19_00335 [Euryarchaeota archaeon]|nr:hypothetical protein [Euryarchaeota archaeon]
MSVEFNENEIKEVMNRLSKDRPIFHSEDDFKFSLAWEIKEEYEKKGENLEIRLEKKLNDSNPYYSTIKEKCKKSSQNNKRDQDKKNERIDIFIIANGVKGKEKIGVELKYFTNELKLQNANNGEKFILANQAAQNEKCYDSWHDVEKLENFILQKEIDKGFTIWLTNISLLTDCSRIKDKENQYYYFRICNNREIDYNKTNELKEHCLKWNDNKGKEIKRRNRLDPIYISGNYKIKWEKYSDLIEEINKKNYIDLIKETDKVKPKKDYQFKFSILEIRPNRTLI